MTGEMVRKRRREHEERPEAVNQFGQCMQLAQKAVDSYKVGNCWVHGFGGGGPYNSLTLS